MLHEILLSLSGHPSPLLEQATVKDTSIDNDQNFPLLSPPERALLASLAHLGDLHVRIREHTKRISSSHPSIICRAVASAILSRHLGAFQSEILEVERGILSKDAGYVGGYGIVPLSTIVRKFAPWVRRLEWLWDIAFFMLPSAHGVKTQGDADTSSGAAVIDQLRKESHTGYVDLADIALSLIQVAESAWMRQLSTWLLYGKLPSFGKEDFFIQLDPTNRGGELDAVASFTLDSALLPDFVTPECASSMLFIGKSLNHIRAIGMSMKGNLRGSTQHDMALLGAHLEHLGKLQSPLSTSSLSSAISEIRSSLSRNGLSQLLPLPKILEMLSLLHAFFLLGRGEFAVALVMNADKRVQTRTQRPGYATTKGSKGVLDGVAVKEGEVKGVLHDTWMELLSLQNEEDPADEELELAREILYISVGSIQSRSSSQHGAEISEGIGKMTILDTSFSDFLFPSPTFLSLRLRPPMDLFVTATDTDDYSTIHAYLLGIRRAGLRLNELWKHTSLRKSHPSPFGPPQSNSKGGQSRLQARRARENIRAVLMRPIWATASGASFILSELGNYLQGEVVSGHWQHLRDWLENRHSDSPSSANTSRPGTASSRLERSDFSLDSGYDGSLELSKRSKAHHDPETLSAAHRDYLSSLMHCLFMKDIVFTRTLRELLTSIDHFIALIINLQTVQENLDLETDEGVVDSLANYAADEKEVQQNLQEAMAEVEKCMKAVISRLREIDENRMGGGREMFTGAAVADGTYVPWKGASVDRLLMKLDFGSSMPPTDEQNG